MMDDEVMTAKQVKDIQKPLTQLEEDLILKKRLTSSRHTRTVVHKFRFQHNIKILCRILGITSAPTINITIQRQLTNQVIASKILHIYAHYTNGSEHIKSPVFFSVIMTFTSTSDECIA